MDFAALAALALAALVALGRRPLFAHAYARLLGIVFAVVGAGGGLFELARGALIAGALLVLSAAWLANEVRRSQPVTATREMGRAEAASMLGVPETASKEEIEASFRRLMARVHPDKGGAAGLAAQLNAARAVLLAGKR
ncbi:MAG TPA: DnaJ domain-containing protein [Caulobacteraceae bacterium]|jgi:hypothetical protein